MGMQYPDQDLFNDKYWQKLALADKAKVVYAKIRHSEGKRRFHSLQYPEMYESYYELEEKLWEACRYLENEPEFLTPIEVTG